MQFVWLRFTIDSSQSTPFKLALACRIYKSKRFPPSYETERGDELQLRYKHVGRGILTIWLDFELAWQLRFGARPGLARYWRGRGEWPTPNAACWSSGSSSCSNATRSLWPEPSWVTSFSRSVRVTRTCEPGRVCGGAEERRWPRPALVRARSGREGGGRASAARRGKPFLLTPDLLQLHARRG
jgi:hypothetical protein